MTKFYYSLLLCFFFCQLTQAQEIDTPMWVADRPVLATARSGNAVYPGGDFSCVVIQSI